MPGLAITQYTGVPGGSFDVQIRGTNSIANGVAPLYIVDGVPYPSQSFPNKGFYILQGSRRGGSSGGNPPSYINVNDIESISILKDADATAIYGFFGAQNGVRFLLQPKRVR